jgi:hypothetical protein
VQWFLDNLFELLLFYPINRTRKMYPPWMIVGSMVGSWLVFGIIERLINAIVSTLWYMACGFDDGEAKYSFGAMQLMTYSCSSFSRVLTSATNVLVQAVSGVASWLFLAATILLFTGIMYMAYEQYPVMARGFTTQWNSGIGNTLQELLVRPLQVLNLVAGQVLPLWNTFAWISKRAVKEGLEVRSIRIVSAFSRRPPDLPIPSRCFAFLTQCSSFWGRSPSGRIQSHCSAHSENPLSSPRHLQSAFTPSQQPLSRYAGSTIIQDAYRISVQEHSTLSPPWGIFERFSLLSLDGWQTVFAVPWQPHWTSFSPLSWTLTLPRRSITLSMPDYGCSCRSHW